MPRSSYRQSMRRPLTQALGVAGLLLLVGAGVVVRVAAGPDSDRLVGLITAAPVFGLALAVGVYALLVRGRR